MIRSRSCEPPPNGPRRANRITAIVTSPASASDCRTSDGVTGLSVLGLGWHARMPGSGRGLILDHPEIHVVSDSFKQHPPSTPAPLTNTDNTWVCFEFFEQGVELFVERGRRLLPVRQPPSSSPRNLLRCSLG